MYTQLLRCFQLAALLSFMAALPLGAQTTLSERVNDITVPSSASSVYIDIKGGAGGDALTFTTVSPHCDAKGGSGAIVKAVFKIGNGTNEIPAGSTLRFIRGEKGETEEYAAVVVGAGDAGGGGGGGSAVLYRKPGATGDNDWITLAVAGGGGGAYSGMFAFSCTDVHHGKGGMITNTGGSGKVKSSPDMQGGADGSAGEAFSNTSGGGAGALASADDNTLNGNGDPAQKGYPSGGGGGHCAGCQSGGWGFGGGGWSFYGPGGGGGFSGGGAGSIGEAGGGGSYLNDMNIGLYMEAGKNGGGSVDGYVRYKFDPGTNLTYSLQQMTTVQFAFNTGKCIDDYGSHTGNGTNIQTYTCTGKSNQQWIFNPGDRTIRSKLNLEKCLDLSNSNTNNGTNIQLFTCNGSSAQKWVYNGIHKTIHSGVSSDKCFEATNGVANSSSNVNIRLWDCNYSNTNEQKWTIGSASVVSSAASVKHIIPVLATNFAVHSHTAAELGSNIQLWTKDNTNQYEQWYFDGLAIKLINYHNLCVDLQSSNTSNGNNIQLYNCNNTNAQKWIYDGVSQAIRSVVDPDKCMQIMKNSDGAYGKRSNVEIHDCDGSTAQRFSLQE